MKTITINVSKPTYREFQQFAKAQDRTTSELIRAAMDEYRKRHINKQHTLRDISPVSVGKILTPMGPDDDVLNEMING